MLKTKGMIDIQKTEELNIIRGFWFFGKKGHLWVVKPKPLWKDQGVMRRLESGLLVVVEERRNFPKQLPKEAAVLLFSVDLSGCWLTPLPKLQLLTSIYLSDTYFSQPVQPN